MKQESANSSPTNDSSRCQHQFANRQRCRTPVLNSTTAFCHRHAALPENQQTSADLTAILTDGLDKFTSAAPINDFLSRLLLLLAQDRICARRAAVLAYITNQLLRTVSVMDKEAEDNDPKNVAPRIIWTSRARHMSTGTRSRRYDLSTFNSSRPRRTCRVYLYQPSVNR